MSLVQSRQSLPDLQELPLSNSMTLDQPPTLPQLHLLLYGADTSPDVMRMKVMASPQPLSSRPHHGSHLVTQARHSHIPGRTLRLQVATLTKEGWQRPQGRERLSGQEPDLGGPRSSAGLLPFMGLRLGNSSQNLYSLSESHNGAEFLHIWL